MDKEFVVFFKGELAGIFGHRFFATQEEAKAFFEMAQGKLVDPELVVMAEVSF
jgi:hypothetical protein